MRIALAAVLSMTFQAFGMQILVLPVPRSYHAFYFFLLVMTTTVTRFSYRALHMYRTRAQAGGTYEEYACCRSGRGRQYDHSGVEVQRYLNRRVVGVIDDNPSKKGRFIQGVRILGNRNDIVDIAKKYEVEEIIVAIPSAPQKEIGGS